MTRARGTTEPIRWRPINGPIGTRPRGLIATVAIVVALIAAIAMANGVGRNTTGESAAAEEEAGFTEDLHSQQGAQRTAAKTVSALGSEKMFNRETRHALVEDLVDPARESELQDAFDDAYSPAFIRKLGLTEQGKAPEGATFVNRMMPAGVTVNSYRAEEAELAVWGLGLLGLTGPGVETEIPVSESWHTTTLTLRWTSEGWKLSHFKQADGPEPTERVTFGQTPEF